MQRVGLKPVLAGEARKSSSLLITEAKLGAGRSGEQGTEGGREKKREGRGACGDRAERGSRGDRGDRAERGELRRTEGGGVGSLGRCRALRPWRRAAHRSQITGDGLRETRVVGCPPAGGGGMGR